VLIVEIVVQEWTTYRQNFRNGILIKVNFSGMDYFLKLIFKEWTTFDSS
jgi:hypothetical protein